MPQTSVALRNAVARHPGPVSGLARIPEDPTAAPSHTRVQWHRRSFAGVTGFALTVAGAVPDSHRLPVSPGRFPVPDRGTPVSGTQGKDPAAGAIAAPAAGLEV